MVTETGKYLPLLEPDSPFAPAYFRDRIQNKDSPDPYTERRRMSVLRSQTLRHTVLNADGFTGADVAIFTVFMQQLSNKKCTIKESELAGSYAKPHCKEMRSCLRERRWEKWPSTPGLAFAKDPDESIGGDNDGSDEWFTYLKKWKKMKKAGKVGNETMAEAHRAWRDKWEAERNRDALI